MAGGLAECKHGLQRIVCGICNPPAAPVTLDVEAVTAFARYAGRCPSCDEPIEPGEEIGTLGDGPWVCAACLAG